MKHRSLAAVLVVLVALLAGAAWAANTTSRVRLTGIPPVVVSVDGTSAAQRAVDTGSNAFRRDVEVACVVSGQAVNLLVRLTSSGNGLFVDVVTGSTPANLQTNVAAINFSGRSHPAPTADAIDTATMTAAQ